MRYLIINTALVEILGLLSDLLQLRITFFDVDDRESADEKSLPRSKFCILRRNSDAEFNRRCEVCDKMHLDEAKHKQSTVIYRCHAGLLEGIVPLYNRHNHYLGSIVFGQIDDRKIIPGVKYGTEDDLHKICHLLQLVSLQIIQQDIIQLLRPQWVTAAEQYIAGHWNQKIRMAELCKVSGVPFSQIAHDFSREFGVPLRTYLNRIRLEKAKLLLEKGKSVKECASQCGFYDEFHFSKAFKKQYGIPPSQQCQGQ